MNSLARRKTTWLFSTTFVALFIMPAIGISQEPQSELGTRAKADLSLQQQMKLAGENRTQLEQAIEQASPNQAKAIRFLIENMPKRDLESLAAKFLLADVQLALKTRSDAPWELPEDIFLNYVLPYRNTDEPLEDWRPMLREKCLPMVAQCKTPAEAAQRLNQLLFKELSVKYSTRRKRANQAPGESIEQGLASCTGLSILLVDACRSVGVPARLAGIPKWANKRGNHTWVEIWSEGQWYFTGAAEFDPKGLNRTWFQADAAQAKADSRLSAIYAVSFKKTDTLFPLVWARTSNVYAINVTERYVPDKKVRSDSVRLLVRVWNADKTRRLVSDVKVTQVGQTKKEQSGLTKAGTADMNDMLSFSLKPDTKYQMTVSVANRLLYQAEVDSGNEKQKMLEVVLDSVK